MKSTALTILILGACCTAAAGEARAPNRPLTIRLRTREPAVVLAGEELAKYLGRMAGDPRAAAVVTDGKARIEIGLFRDFGMEMEGVADPALDDAIIIDVRNSKGVIAGSNPRSVLFAAYRFLESSGCRWIRPGPAGDFVPSRRTDNLTARIRDFAANRFRGNMNAGTYDIDTILSKIEWGPKVGLNTFFNEFLIPKKNYVNWYSRKYASNRAPEGRTDAEITAYHELLNREVKRRGMWLQAGGHGWNGRFLGNPEVECDHDGVLVIPDEKTEYLALVGGTRQKGGGPTKVELCYGRPDVREGLVRVFADYAESRPEVDYLHFWFDDRSNNTCECELCRDRRVSDFYLMVLNDIDRELTRRNLPTRVVFLVYQDLRWPPETERFANPDRFVMMFAPSGRKYDVPYEVPTDDVALPSYRLNQNARTHDVREHVGFLRAWQKLFRGTGFVYDYHMVWYHFYDQGYYGMLDVLAEDIRRLPQIDLHGFVSCQNQKAFFPHGLPTHAHARLLWNPESSVDDLAAYYFDGAFGADGARALEYMKTLSDLFSPKHFYVKRRIRDAPVDERESAEALARLARVGDAVREFRPVIERNLADGDPARRFSWKLLSVHAGMAPLMADALRAEGSEKKSEAAARWTALRDYLVEHEGVIENVFDVYWFGRTFSGVK